MRLTICIILLFVLKVFSQDQDYVDFTRVDATIQPYSNRLLRGVADYEFNVLKKVDTIFFDAIDMAFSEIYYDGINVSENTVYNKKQLKLGLNLKPGMHHIKLEFSAQPKQTLYFMERDSLDYPWQIWTQGQGKYTSHWLPSFDDMNEKLEFDVTFQVPKGYQVIANGNLVDKTPVENQNNWKFDMKQPMSSYLVAFVVGRFDKKVIKSSSGVPIELYYEPKDSLRVEPTYCYTQSIFDFLEQEIAVPYPWQNYKQVPVHDFLYAGMENTSCTIFSNQYVIDATAFVDKNYVNVNAHELAHQWFGNLVTEVNGKAHWLHEGFATYYAYLTEKQLFGDEHFYWKLYQTAQTLRSASQNGGGTALTDPNADSLTFYEKGAWALVMLRAYIGDLAFKKGIKVYLETYAFKNAAVRDFLKVMEKVSEMHLGSFREKWLLSTTFPWEEAKRYLIEKSSSIKKFIELQDLFVNQKSIDSKKIQEVWTDEMPTPFKRELLFSFGKKISDATLISLLDDASIDVRQALALSLPTISESLKPLIESMLNDASYLTQEVVLFKLWQAFPANRKTYLDALNGVVGFPSKNIRLIWLTLTLLTENYQDANRRSFYNELINFTDAKYHFEIRQLAFQYLHQMNAMNDYSLKNLLKASNHHVWHFKKFSKNLIRNMHASSDGKTKLETFKTQLSEADKQQLETILNP